jgi:hypothetical protein
MEIIIAVVDVTWRDTLQAELHNQVTYVISHLGTHSNRQVRRKMNSWLKVPKDAEQVYTRYKIVKFERTTTDEQHNDVLLNGFVHVNLETMTVSYYAQNDEEDGDNSTTEAIPVSSA